MTLLTVVVLALLGAAPKALRRHRELRAGRPRRRPGKFATMCMVVTLLGLQMVITAPPASAAACGEAPNPERPGSGMVGALDPAEAQGEAGSAYIDYSYAGMVWNVFETDCGPLSGITSPTTTIDTWAGNQLFNLGKNIVGATNSLHYTVMEGGLLTPLYNAVKSGADKVYNNIYTKLFALVALLLAIVMFRNIWRGDLNAVSKRALYALAAVWLAASSLALLRYFDPIDKAIVQTTTNIQAGFIDDQNRATPHVLPTDLHNKVVYENWLRGEFGSPQAPQAEQFGRPLLDAQAFTWDQIRGGDDANQSVVDGKKAAFKNISGQLGPATGYFTGEAGGRAGAGFIAFGQSLVYSLFQLLAKAAVLLAQVLIRLFALTAPLIGLVALLHHDILRRVAKVIGVVAFNLLVLAVLAGVHALLLQAIFAAGNALNMLTQMALAGMVTILLFLVARPVRRLWQMVEMSVSMVGAAVPTQGGGLFSRFRRNQDKQTPQDEFWQNVRDTDEAVEGESGGVPGGGGRFRPEAATVFASAQRLDGNAAAGSAARAAGAAGATGAPSTALAGFGARPALPASGGGPVPFATPGAGRSPGDQVPMEQVSRSDGWQMPRPSSRRVDTSPVFDRRWSDEPEPVVVPSAMNSGAGPQPEAAYVTPPPAAGTSPSSAVPMARSAPRRADSEVVAGKPVFVVYRPSRGLEVREDLRDTDAAVQGR